MLRLGPLGIQLWPDKPLGSLTLGQQVLVSTPDGKHVVGDVVVFEFDDAIVKVYKTGSELLITRSDLNSGRVRIRQAFKLGVHVEVIDTTSQRCWHRGVLVAWVTQEMETKRREQGDSSLREARSAPYWRLIMYDGRTRYFANSQLRIWVNDVYMCPRRHPLELKAIDFECDCACDKCGRDIERGEEVYTCTNEDTCNYDVCQGCEDNSSTVSRLLRLRLTRRDAFPRPLCYRDTEQWLCFRKMPFEKMPFVRFDW